MQGQLTLEGHIVTQPRGIEPFQLADEVVLGRDVGLLGRPRQVRQAAVVLVDAEARGVTGPGLDPGVEA